MLKAVPGLGGHEGSATMALPLQRSERALVFSSQESARVLQLRMRKDQATVVVVEA